MQDFLAKSRANRDELVTLVPAQVQRGTVDFRGKKKIKRSSISVVSSALFICFS